MNSITAIIVDDEPLGLEFLKTQVETYCPQVNIVGQASTIPDAVQKLEQVRPNVVLLDINLPGGSGFDILKQSKHKNCSVIFITAHEEYASMAFRVSAVDYLLKPVNPQQLVAAIEKARQQQSEQHWQERLSVMEDSLRTGRPPQTIVLKSASGFRIAEIDMVVRCKAEGNYTQVYFTDGSTFLASKNLKEMEATLKPYRFFRVHQSHLVNLSHVKAYHKDRVRGVELKDGAYVDLARSKRQRFLELFA